MRLHRTSVINWVFPQRARGEGMILRVLKSDWLNPRSFVPGKKNSTYPNEQLNMRSSADYYELRYLILP